MLFYWMWSLLHRKKFMPGIITMVKSILWKMNMLSNSLSSIYVYIHESFLLMCIVVNINIHSCSKYWDPGTMSAQLYLRHLHTLCPHLRGLEDGEDRYEILSSVHHMTVTHMSSQNCGVLHKIYTGSNQLKL